MQMIYDRVKQAVQQVVANGLTDAICAGVSFGILMYFLLQVGR